MTPEDFLFSVVIRAHALVGMVAVNVPAEAAVLLHAIAGQESEWRARRQVPNGQARGYWQCEKGGAVANTVARHPEVLGAWCGLHDIPFDISTIFEAIAWNDDLAFLVARLELLCDVPPLPAIGAIDAAWATYLRVWRPGQPSRARWNVVYPRTLMVFQAAQPLGWRGNFVMPREV